MKVSTTTILGTPARRAALRLALACGALLAGLVCAGPARAQEGGAEAGARAARGAISGRVVGDGGEPLSFVAVAVQPWGYFRTPRTPQIVASDEDGNFVAAGLAPGVYHVSAHRAGYVPDPEQPVAGNGYRPGDFVTVRMVRGGVITGMVTDAAGAPLVALRVRASRVRDHEGRPTTASWSFIGENQTDDRGVYRIYGLPPGGYVVSVGGSDNVAWGQVSPYEGNAPIFHPAGTRDTAAEVAVRAGQETAGVDIRYRDERGRRVSGTLALPPPAPGQPGEGVLVMLNFAGSGVTAAHAWVGAHETERGFSFDGVGDGDYEARAEFRTREGVSAASAPLRVSVRGADVTGLKLTLAPLASVAGTVSAEAAPDALRALPDCKGRPAAALPQETLVVARRDARPGPAPAQPQTLGARQRETSPDETGAFTLRNLEPGAYRFEARPLDEHFYVRSVRLPAAAAGGARPGAARPAADAPVQLANGQQLAGLSFQLAAGAAAVTGSVSVEAGSPPFGSLRVYLVPAERERADDLPGYAEATPTPAGSFTFRNLAPGRYLLVVRAADPNETRPRPPFWDAEARARLRREAEAAAVTLDLQPCQRPADLTLRYPQKP